MVYKGTPKTTFTTKNNHSTYKYKKDLNTAGLLCTYLEAPISHFILLL